MKREFLQNFKVGDQPLSKEIIDAIMAENGRDIEAAKSPSLDAILNRPSLYGQYKKPLCRKY